MVLFQLSVPRQAKERLPEAATSYMGLFGFVYSPKARREGNCFSLQNMSDEIDDQFPVGIFAFQAIELLFLLCRRLPGLVALFIVLS